MRYLVYLMVVVVVLALLGAGAYILFGSSGDTGAPGASVVITDQEDIAARAVAYVDSPYQDDYGMLRLAGHLDNLSETPIVLARIEFQLLDEDDNKKELVTYELKDVPANSRKTFDANAGSIPPDRKVQIRVVELAVQE